jgi:type IV secretion system protein VirB10
MAASVAAVAFSGQAGAQTEATGSPSNFVVKTGTRVPLALINSVSTKQAAPGDRVYLESVFPVVVDSKIVIPPGTYVAGTVTQVKRPGRLKGRGELYLRFDSMILPNGVMRDFRARVGAIDGRAGEELDREEGKIKGEGNKSGDARTVGEAAGGGATVGAIAGAAGGRPGMGVGIGAAAGAAAGLIGVLLSRGPEAMLPKGTQLDMVLDRELSFSDAEVQFPNTPQRITVDTGTGPVSQRNSGSGIPRLGGGRYP